MFPPAALKFNNMKLKKGINPIGTTQRVRMQFKAEYSWHRYNVLEVTGDANNTPNDGGPVIWMELAEKNAGTLQQFISLPLSVFPQRVQPNEAGDKFWEDGKTVAP